MKNLFPARNVSNIWCLRKSIQDGISNVRSLMAISFSHLRRSSSSSIIEYKKDTFLRCRFRTSRLSMKTNGTRIQSRRAFGPFSGWKSRQTLFTLHTISLPDPLPSPPGIRQTPKSKTAISYLLGRENGATTTWKTRVPMRRSSNRSFRRPNDFTCYRSLDEYGRR